MPYPWCMFPWVMGILALYQTAEKLYCLLCLLYSPYGYLLASRVAQPHDPLLLVSLTWIICLSFKIAIWLWLAYEAFSCYYEGGG